MISSHMNKCEYIKDASTGIEVVSMENVSTSFPPHTHTVHYVFGIVTEGCIAIKIGEEVKQCRDDEYFSIYPDVCHSIETVTETYSLISTCIPGNSNMSGELDIIKNEIIGNPQLEISVAEMSQKVNISSYEFKNIPWSAHPVFAGGELKHIVRAAETDGAYSFHFVRIAPNCSIKDHIHDPQLETHEVIAGYGKCVNGGTEIDYKPGVISIMPAKVHHEVHAGEEGLYLFAKFMPALC